MYIEKIIEEKKGGFIELIGNFLNEEKVDHTTDKGPMTKPNSIKIERGQKAVEIVEKDCKVSTNFYQANDIGAVFGISKSVPLGERTIIRFGKSKNSKDLTIYTGIEAHEGPLGLQATVGKADLDITIKNALKTPSEHSESFVIGCRCNYPFGIKCKATRQRWER